MSSFAPRRSPASQPHPLIAHRSAAAIVAYRRGEPVTAQRFLAEVRACAEVLPDSRHILNFCTDRYLFAVVLCVTIARGQTTLLPPTTTPNVIRAIRAFAADAYQLPTMRRTRWTCHFALPSFESRQLHAPIRREFTIPDPRRTGRRVFTSGSTGEPQRLQDWGGLVPNVQGEARRLEIGPGTPSSAPFRRNTCMDSNPRCCCRCSQAQRLLPSACRPTHRPHPAGPRRAHPHLRRWNSAASRHQGSSATAPLPSASPARHAKLSLRRTEAGRSPPPPIGRQKQAFDGLRLGTTSMVPATSSAPRRWATSSKSTATGHGSCFTGAAPTW